VAFSSAAKRPKAPILFIEEEESNVTITIIGAGMAGLMAANMLRRHDPVVLEAQPSLPNNHSAVLRFRSSVVGDALGIEFKRVTVLKDVESTGNSIRDAHLYSRKVGGVVRSDRSVTRGREVVERWIAPPDLIQRMAEGVNIRYGYQWTPGEGKVISTIPMPVMAKLTHYPREMEFDHMVGWNIVCQMDECESYSSLLVPSFDYPFSRVSFTGDQMIIECQKKPEDVDGIIDQALELTGTMSVHTILAVKRQDYGKIMPIDERERQTFMHWLNGGKGIAYSLGRFACWRPGLLADDLVHDIRVIEKWIRGGEASGFDQDLQLARKS
jgi:hypothetical protein